MSSARGHKHTGSVTQNHKAQLANAYNELGKELSSTKIRVVGNYTLGKVIGEGWSLLSLVNFDLIHHRCIRQGSLGYSPFNVHPGRHKASPKRNVLFFDP